MEERIKELRRELKLTQQAFADRIGVKRNTIGQYEIGRNIPTDTVIALICREFNVNKEWLLTGKGEIFAPDASSEIEALSKKYHLSNAMQIFIEKLVNTSPEVQDALIGLISETAAGIQSMKELGADPAAPAFEDKELTIDEKVAEFRRQLELEEETGKKSSASGMS